MNVTNKKATPKPTTPAGGRARREGQPAREGVELVQLNVEVPKDLRARWKHAALDRETTVTQLVIDAMEMYLSR